MDTNLDILVIGYNCLTPTSELTDNQNNSIFQKPVLSSTRKTILSVMHRNDQWRLRSGSDAQCLIKGGRDPVVCVSERTAP